MEIYYWVLHRYPASIYLHLQRIVEINFCSTHGTKVHLYHPKVGDGDKLMLDIGIIRENCTYFITVQLLSITP